MSDKYCCTEERYLNDVKDHSMEIIRDDGVYRHIKFSRNGSSVYRLDLITWPGRLCIDSDCGTYVFARIPDMFEFFRTDKNDFNYNHNGLRINPGYWGEKLLSIGRNAGYKEFNEEKFRNAIKSIFDKHVKYENLDEDASDDLWRGIENQVLYELENGKEHAFRAAYEFFPINLCGDFPDCDVYTFHFIWCLYAIAWGIKKYDEAKELLNKETA